MADPRKRIQYRSIASEFLTMKYDATITFSDALPGGSASVGLAVTVVAGTNDTASLTTDASPVLGRLERVQWDGYCTVAISGTLLLPIGTGTVTVGLKVCGCLLVAAKGYIRNIAPATLAEVAVARGLVLSNLYASTLQNVATNLMAVLID